MRLIERECELHCIEELIQRAVDGHGHTIVLEGVAGIGKTALLRATSETAARHGMRCLHAHGGELELDLPFAIVRQLFEPVLQAGSPEFRAELLSGAAGPAARVLGPGPVADETRYATASVVHGLYWVCSNLAEHGPICVAVDDAHWADEASLRFVSHIARRLGDLRVMLVLTMHPNRWATAVDRALTGVDSELRQLHPLSSQAIAALVREEFGPDAEDEFCAACAEASGGNPFLLTEAIATLRDDSVSADGTGARQVAHLVSGPITKSVLARLARHGDDAIELARAVALLGPDADLHHAAVLARVAAEDAVRIVDLLERDSILVGSSPIQFLHPLVRSAVDHDLSERLVAAGHKRVVQMLSDEGAPMARLIPHLLAAERTADFDVVKALERAAEEALSCGSPLVAAQCLERALVEPAPGDARAKILARLGHACALANRTDKAEDALRQALALTTGAGPRTEIALELGWLLVIAGRGADAKNVLATALAGLPAGLPRQVRRLYAATMAARFAAHDHPATWTEEMHTSAPTSADLPVEERMLLATTALGACLSGGRSADECAQLAAIAAAGPAPPRERWVIANCAASALSIADRNPEALEVLHQAIDAARADGDMGAFGFLSLVRSHVWFRIGNLVEAEADSRATTELRGHNEKSALSVRAWILLDILVEKGQLDHAEQILVSHELDGEITAQGAFVHFALRARGRLRRSQHRFKEAREDLERVGHFLTDSGCVNPGYLHWRTELALVYLAMDRPDEARALAEEEVELARRFGAARAIGVSLRTRGLVERGNRRIDLLAESARVLASTSASLEHARTLVDLGTAQRRMGYRTEATETLRRGLDLATTAYAEALIERARAELVVVGARPRRDRCTGPDALTASEHRVAILAVEGYTNREIAERLFVSRRTVELHLTNTFRKLQINSRQGLRKAVSGIDAAARPKDFGGHRSV